jgi:Domain of unknown function (DUF4126)
METLDHLTSTLALTMGLAWASGINLYATLLTLGFLANSGNINLPPDLQIVANPLVMGAAGIMYFVEFFVDKTPGADSGWDAIHTFIRIPAGAMLAAGAVGDLNSAVEIAAALLGGSLAAGTHATKTGTRLLINTSPEPFTNWTASVAEDAAVVSGVWASINYPSVFLAGLIVFVMLMIWFLPRIWVHIKKVFRTIQNWFRKQQPPVDLNLPQ